MIADAVSAGQYVPRMLARRVPLLAALIAAALVAVPPAQAAEFAVSTTADGDDVSVGDGQCKVAVTSACSLRAALQQANASFGADTVTVPAGTYVLTLGAALTISQSVTLAGAGARETTIDGPDGTYVMNITGGSPVTVRGLAITSGAIGVNVANADVAFDEVAIRDNTWVTASQRQRRRTQDRRRGQRPAAAQLGHRQPPAQRRHPSRAAAGSTSRAAR